MKLCVFQGTFNPIHNAHLAMAKFIKDYMDVDSILFIPAYKPPHKDFDPEMSEHRYKMVKLAITGESFYQISNIEFQNERFSYTYLTIQELYKRYKIDGKINFIIGSDAFKEIQSWYESNNLKRLVKFIVFAREPHFNPESINHLAQRGYDFIVVNKPFEDISSTQIREKLSEGLPVLKYVPLAVSEYIQKNGLYKNQ